jgi:sugar phosphate isomerase/epimerase
MKLSICHYSFHRRWADEGWDCDRLAQEVQSLGIGAVDYHVRFLGDPKTAGSCVLAALDKHGLELSGLSMSNNFNMEDPTAQREQIDSVKMWLEVAAEVKAPASRIFGGHLPLESRGDAALRSACLKRITDAIAEVTRTAEELGIVLALENHGGLPCTGEEQVDVIEAINSPNLRATIDVGNYMQGAQEGHEGSAAAAKYATYTHFKDFKKTASAKDSPLPWGLEPCVVGEGDVDHLACARALAAVGYDGYIALEYEGTEDEKTGVPKSLDYMREVVAKL